jgi:hypothetical protein
MPPFVRRYLPWVIIGGILYFLLSFHFIIVGSGVKLLKKSKMTLEYTFYNVNGRKNSTILSVDDLRRDGIGELLMDADLMKKSEYESLMEKYGEEG